MIVFVVVAAFRTVVSICTQFRALDVDKPNLSSTNQESRICSWTNGLFRWKIAQEVNGTSSGVVLCPMRAVSAVSVPSTRLRINESGTHLAVGASDGSVTVFAADTLRKV